MTSARHLGRCGSSLWRSLRIVLLLAVCAAGAPLPVVAQSTAPAEAPAAARAATPDDLQALIDNLKDDAARARLIAQLDALLAAQKAAASPDQAARSPGTVARLTDRLTRTGQDIVEGALLPLRGDRLRIWFARQIDDPARHTVWMRAAWTFLALAVSALIVEWAIRRLVARPRSALEAATSRRLLAQVARSLSRMVLEIVPLAAFLLTAHSVAPLLETEPLTLAVVLAVIDASVIARVILALCRVILAPRVPALRLAPLADDDATYFYVWVRRLTMFAVYGALAAEIAALIGAEAKTIDAVDFAYGLILTLMLVVLVLQNRAAVARVIRGEQDTTAQGSSAGAIRRQLAELWHVLAVLYIVGSFLIWLLRIDGGFSLILRGTGATAAIFLIATVIAVALRRAVQRGLQIDDDLKARFPGIELRANRYLAIVQYALRGVIFVVAFVAALQAWGIDAFAWLTEGFGRHLVGSLVISLVMIVLAVIVWELVSSWIQRTLAAAEGGEAQISARARTLLPLMRNVLMISLAALVVLLVLSEFGLNIGPLLAGAGIVGLAVGFGAQTLVKDVITGFFILMENQISVGDVVRVSAHSGVVEGLTIRTLRLRDLGGNVHIIPFSEVTTVENMTKDFSRYVFDVGIAYREDTDQVVEVLTQIGAEMQADETFGPMILAPLDILGVDRFDDSAVIVRARFTTQPIKQWQVGREFNRRMKKRFDELGIEIPFPHRTIYFGIDKEGDAPPARIHLDDPREPGAATEG